MRTKERQLMKKIFSGLLIASVIFNGVGAYLVPNNFTTYAEAAEGTETLGEVIDPLAKYEFLDATNPGKDSMGNYDLEVKLTSESYAPETANITVNDGVATFDGSAGLRPTSNDKDISEKLSSFTLVFEMKPSINTTDWSTPVGFGWNGWTQTKWGNFNIAKNTSTLYFGTHTDGGNDAYWESEIGNLSTDEFCTVVLSAQLGGKMTVYLDGVVKYSKDLPSDYSLKDENMRFAIGGSCCWGNIYDTYTGSLSNVRVYDFAFNTAQVSQYLEEDDVYQEFGAEINPLAKYEFLDSSNPGKDTMGNYHLTTKAQSAEVSANIVVNEGAATFDGTGILVAEKTNDIGDDIGGDLDSFTLVFKVKGPEIPSNSWASPIGFGWDNWTATKWAWFSLAPNSQKLRFTTHTDGNANRDWGKELKDLSSASYSEVILTAQIGGKMTIYFDGVNVYEYDLPSDYSLKSDDMRFAIGGSGTWGNVNYAFSGSLKDVRVYDFAFDTAQLNQYMKHQAVYEEARYFTNKEPLKNYAYSFAVLGDTQIVTDSDVKNGTNNLSKIYDWLLANKASKNIQYVFGLGDITDYNQPAEWEHAKTEIAKLDGEIPYSVVRGNHDLAGYNYQSEDQFTNYLGTESYKSQFANGGFYSESNIWNSWRTFTVGETNYLLFALDYGPSDNVLAWVGDIIEQYPEHKVIISTHSYLKSNGEFLTSDNSTIAPSLWGGYNDADDMWEKLVSRYENIVLVMCGHEDSEEIVVTKKEGIHGNIVTSMLVNPQGVDAREGHTGMVAMLYFSEDGKKVQVEYYSTVREKYFLQENQFDMRLMENGESYGTRQVETEIVAPVAKYEFLDADNPGKDSMENYDLVVKKVSDESIETGSVSVDNGTATFNGTAALIAPSNEKDISESLKSFTVAFDIKLSDTLSSTWATPVGFGWNAWNKDGGLNKWGNFHIASGETKLRFSTHSDGSSTQYWGSELGKISATEYSTVVLSAQLGEKMTVYVNGVLKYSKDLPADYSLQDENMRFALGGSSCWGNAYHPFIGSLKNVSIYDFAFNDTQASRYVFEKVVYKEKVIQKYTADEFATYRVGGAGNYTAPEAPEGYVFGGWFTDTICATALTANTIAEGSYAYAKFVASDLLNVKCQIPATATAEDETTTLRLVTSVDSLKYSMVGFVVSVEGVEGSTLYTTREAYTDILATISGTTISYMPYNISADAGFFMALELEGVPNEVFDKNITVAPAWKTLDGTIVMATENCRSDINIAEAISAMEQ